MIIILVVGHRPTSRIFEHDHAHEEVVRDQYQQMTPRWRV